MSGLHFQADSLSSCEDSSVSSACLSSRTYPSPDEKDIIAFVACGLPRPGLVAADGRWLVSVGRRKGSGRTSQCFVKRVPAATPACVDRGRRAWPTGLELRSGGRRLAAVRGGGGVRRDYAGDLVEVRATGGEPLVATGNHPFWVEASVLGTAELEGRPLPHELSEAEARGPPGVAGRWVECGT